MATEISSLEILTGNTEKSSPSKSASDWSKARARFRGARKSILARSLHPVTTFPFAGAQFRSLGGFNTLDLTAFFGLRPSSAHARCEKRSTIWGGWKMSKLYSIMTHLLQGMQRNDGRRKRGFFCQWSLASIKWWLFNDSCKGEARNFLASKESTLSTPFEWIFCSN